MKVTCLSLVDFRNYKTLALEPGLGANLLLGANGAGKTNILEALHLATTGLSHRAARDRDMIRHGCDAFAVKAAVARDEFPDAPSIQQIVYSGGRKTVKKDDRVLIGRGRSEVLGAAVVFSPDDLALIKGPPSGRRGYLDMVMAKADPRYRGLLRRYEAALAQRNRLLSEPPAASASAHARLLEPWTEQLIGLGASILEYRLRGLRGLGPAITDAYAGLAGEANEGIEISYTYGTAGEPLTWTITTAEVPTRPSLETQLRDAFAGTARGEVQRRVTLAGPHRDDLTVLMGLVPFRVFGSQGQQRSAALALRLAEARFLQRVLNERPLLLLDDVFSELDQGRRQALLELLGLTRAGHQTVVTATDLLGLPGHDELPVTTFRVECGGVSLAAPA